MLAQTLYVQWKWNRDFLAFFTGMGFATPLLVLWIGLPDVGVPSPRELIAVGNVVGGSALFVATLAGASVAWHGYGIDERAGHLYALSLPVTRRRLLGLRALTAAVILSLPALGVWVGATLAAAQLTLPVALHTYPGSLAVRVLLASWVAHSLVFAIRYASGRRAKLVVAVLLLCVSALPFVATVAPGTRATVARIGVALASAPGPFGVLLGRWTLIDV